MHLDDDATLARILRESLELDRKKQAGVVTRGQLLAGRWGEVEIRRAVRRRELVRVHPRVYVDHTGPLTAAQRGWAAVLWAEPAALCGPTVLGAAADGDVHVAVESHRRLTPPSGVVAHPVTHLDAMIRVGSAPPRLSLEHHALLQAGRAATETEVVAALTDTIGRLGTSAASVRAALALHPNIARRRLVVALLDDIEQRTESVLEHGFLTRVERPHGLPTPARQSVRRDGRERRDLEYLEFGMVVELDGRLGHDSWRAANRDAGRDLADVAEGRVVPRLPELRSLMVSY